MSARSTIAAFDQVAAQNDDNLRKNPYSDTYELQHFDPAAKDYGRPPSGSKTEARGIKAGYHICREIIFLCELINENAEGEAPYRYIKFGRLFSIYSLYSESLVGMMIRARKYGLIHFEGEMLYQRQDDEKIVTMRMPIDDIRRAVQPTDDPKNCVILVGAQPAPLPDWIGFPGPDAKRRAPPVRRLPGQLGDSKPKPLTFGTSATPKKDSAEAKGNAKQDGVASTAKKDEPSASEKVTAKTDEKKKKEEGAAAEAATTSETKPKKKTPAKKRLGPAANGASASSMYCFSVAYGDHFKEADKNKG